MSKTIGVIEDVEEGKRLYVTSFFGGSKQGRCIQLTPEKNYAALNRAGVEELRDLFNKWLAGKDLPDLG